MFLEFYGLREQPFGVTPDPRFLYLSPAHREALASLYYGIESGRGFLALIAKPGMGKTTLLFQLLEKFRGNARTAFLFQTQCSSREFMRFLLAELGFESQEQDFVRMHDEFNKLLLQEARAGRRFIIVVDEAQNLDASVLETIRLLSDFETPRAKLLQIILAGQPELADKLASSKMAQLRQRISLLNGLSPLSVEESSKYIQHRLRIAGHSGALLFAPAAMQAIAQFTEGIPRSINNFCFSALSLGCALRQRIIDLPIVEEVISDLDITKLITEVPLHPHFDPDRLPPPAGGGFPAPYDNPYAGRTLARDTLTPAEARAYMRQLAVQLKGWKGN
jgi:general secretion pathway protein A